MWISTKDINGPICEPLPVEEGVSKQDGGGSKAHRLLRHIDFSGSKTFVSLNSRLESNKEEEEEV